MQTRKNQLKSQQGFTLIELMIVVAIVGILAAVAIPAYRDYITRSKVSECAATLAACKTSVTEYFLSRNGFPADADEAGCDLAGGGANVSQYCRGIVVPSGAGVGDFTASVTGSGSIDVTGSMAITVRTDNTGVTTGGVASDCVLQLAPVTFNRTIVEWVGGTDCDGKFVSATFRD